MFTLAGPRGVRDLKLPTRGNPRTPAVALRALAATGPPGQSAAQLGGGTRPGCGRPRGHGLQDAGPAGLRPADRRKLPHSRSSVAGLPPPDGGAVGGRAPGSTPLAPLLLPRLWAPAVGAAHTEFSTRPLGGCVLPAKSPPVSERCPRPLLEPGPWASQAGSGKQQTLRSLSGSAAGPRRRLGRCTVPRWAPRRLWVRRVRAEAGASCRAPSLSRGVPAPGSSAGPVLFPRCARDCGPPRAAVKLASTLRRASEAPLASRARALPRPRPRLLA